MNSRNLRDALIGSYASTNRRFDVNDANVMRNVNIMRQTVGSVIYKGDEPVTLEEFVSANRAAGKSDSEILLDWYAEHDPHTRGCDERCSVMPSVLEIIEERKKKQPTTADSVEVAGGRLVERGGRQFCFSRLQHV